MTDLSRREVLAAGVTAGVSGLAGCIDSFVEGDESEDGDESSSDDQMADSNDDNSTDESLEVVEVSTETIDSSCKSGGEEGASVDIKGDTVEVAGTIHTPDPCHVATVEGAVSGTTLELDVAAEEDDEENCVSCVGSVEYETVVQLSTEGVEEVDVVHGDDDESVAGMTTAQDSAGSLSVETAETLEATCGQGEEEVTATREDGALTIEGVIQAPNPCHEALVTGVTTEDGVSTVNVAAESTLGENEMCQSCIADVSYRVELSAVEGALDSSVRVEHSTGFSQTV